MTAVKENQGTFVNSLQTATPRRELADFVRVFVQREIRCDGMHFAQPNIATLEQVLAFDFEDQILLERSGVQDSLCPRINAWGSLRFPGVTSRINGHSVGFAIFLRPWASWRLFRIPPRAIAGLVFEGEDFVGHDVRDLWAKMAAKSAFYDRVLLAEEFLMPFVINAAVCDTIMATVEYMVRRRGATRIDELAHHSGLGVRQYERRFTDAMGLSPKLFARTTRFQMSLDLKRAMPLRSWASIAHALHYSDQMHMVRDFHKLGGESPTKLMQRVWDMQPWSLATKSNGGIDESKSVILN